jgi:hypothetical protein
MLLAGLNKVRTETFPTVVSAMNAAATTDLRNVVLTPVLTRLIGASTAPDARARRATSATAASGTSTRTCGGWPAPPA